MPYSLSDKISLSGNLYSAELRTGYRLLNRQKIKVMKLELLITRGLIIFSVLLPFDQLIAQPTITSFEPAIGPIGPSVTIIGTGFDMNPTNNVVFFGATQAVVSEAETTSLAVVVPLARLIILLPSSHKQEIRKLYSFAYQFFINW